MSIIARERCNGIVCQEICFAGKIDYRFAKAKFSSSHNVLDLEIEYLLDDKRNVFPFFNFLSKVLAKGSKPNIAPEISRIYESSASLKVVVPFCFNLLSF